MYCSIKTGRVYTADCSDLKVFIKKVHYESTDYYKVKLSLINKNNGIVYETKNCKLYKDKITHWKNTTWE